MKKADVSTDLSIVIPAYREAKRLGESLLTLGDYLKHDNLIKNVAVEVIVVAAQAHDDTAEVARRYSSKLPSLRIIEPGRRVGKGRDVRAGMLAAKGRAVVFMDADLATPLDYISEFWGIFEEGYDVVYGTRDLTSHHPAFMRRLISRFGNVLFRILCGVSTEDSQCGFKMFSYQAAQLCFSKMTILGWGFDMEILTIARLHKLKMKSVRINNWRSVEGGSFTDNVLRSSLNSFRELLYIFLGRLNGRYK